MPSRLQQKLESGGFAVTAEIFPPHGSDPSAFLAKAALVRDLVDAVNVTDNQGARMRISPLAGAALLLREGIEPVMQLTCRDRNRLALQSELLGAAALGVKNLLALTGDHLSFGDSAAAKPVFDLDSVQLLQAVDGLNGGVDMAGAALEGKTCFFAGAAAAPAAEPFELAMIKIRKKSAAGARFFQTQAVFDTGRLRSFVEATRPLGVKVLAGIFLLRSAGMARYINANIPGLQVPDPVVERLASATDPAAEGIAIARETITECRGICDGMHVMAMGREELLPQLLHGLT